jgi:hypothetical protein
MMRISEGVLLLACLVSAEFDPSLVKEPDRVLKEPPANKDSDPGHFRRIESAEEYDTLVDELPPGGHAIFGVFVNEEIYKPGASFAEHKGAALAKDEWVGDQLFKQYLALANDQSWLPGNMQNTLFYYGKLSWHSIFATRSAHKSLHHPSS